MNRAVFFLLLAIITQSVAARVSDCKEANPRDVESVFHCITSYRQAPSGRNIFEGFIATANCRTLSKQYLNALRYSGVRFKPKDKAALHAALPSCAIFSEIARRYTGKPSWWSSCLGRPESGEHLKNCLEGTAKWNARPLSYFGGCEGLKTLYKKGLTAASNFTLWRNITLKPDYLAAFENMGCKDYLAVLTKQAPATAARWSACMNYRPENGVAHLRACLGNEIRNLNTCQRVRIRYEQKIKEAAGGVFPPGYTMLDCALAEGLIAEEKKRVQKERQAAQDRAEQRKRLAREQYRAAQQRARAQNTVTAPAPGRELAVETSGSIISQWVGLITFIVILIFLWRKGILGKILKPFSTSDLWKMTWEKISDRDDFPNTVVYRKDGPKYKIYRVSFDNKELIVKGWRAILKGWLFVAGFFAVFPVASILVESGWDENFTFFLMIVIIVIWFNKIKLPWTVKRIIELDRNTDKLRVFNEGHLAGERKLSRLENLTVDVHPDAEFVRMSRQERREKGLSKEEKSHCLFGWFGIEGAERVILITRAEWPNYSTLSEVRLAVLWARKLAFGADGAVDSAPDSSKPEDRGMKPPLD